jgi:hypothetical protein
MRKAETASGSFILLLTPKSAPNAGRRYQAVLSVQVKGEWESGAIAEIAGN